VFFGATVAYRDAGGAQHTVSIVGTDEVDPARGRVSWVSSDRAGAAQGARRRRGDIQHAGREPTARSSRDSLRGIEVRKPGTDHHIRDRQAKT